MSGMCMPVTCLGCGAGLGAIAVSWLQGSGGDVRDIPRAATWKSFSEAGSPTAQELVDSPNAGVVWLNNLVEILWPRINQYLENFVKEEIVPKIDEALPPMLRGSVKFPSVSIGQAVPKFQDIKVEEREDKGIVIQVSVDIDCKVDVKIKAMRVPVGIKELVFRGELTAVLRPPSPKPPFFGGVEIYFVDPPTIDFDFTGVADVADWKVIKGAIMGIVMDQISDLVVIPERQIVDLLPDDEVGEADLKFPEPIGVLRVLVKSAADLRGADMNLLGQRTSDPYVEIRLGKDRWKSKAVPKTTNPTWEHGNVRDFLIFDKKQRADFLVFDEDRMSKDDLLGGAMRVSMRHFAKGGSVIDETLKLLSGDTGQSAGTLTISTRYFGLSDKVPKDGISRAVARGPTQLVLAAKIIRAGGLTTAAAANAGPPYVVHLAVGSDHEAKTRPSSATAKAIGKATTANLNEVCQELHKRQLPVTEIAKITGLSNETVNMVLQQASSECKAAYEASRKLRATSDPEFDQILRLLLPWTEEMTKSTITLEIQDKKGRVVGGPVRQKLSDVVASREPPGELSWLEAPYALEGGATLQFSLRTQWLTIEA